jgi:glycosyltransferase involved in cell wall biosynthesis
MTGVHVLQIIDGLNVGGAEMLMRELAPGLLKRGFRVSVAYSTPGPIAADLQAMGIPLTRLPRLARVDPILLLRMARLMRQDRPHIVHTHLFKSDFHGRPAARLAGVPVVVSTLHNSDPWARKLLLGSLYASTARLADRLIAVSDEVRDYYLAHTHLQPEKVVTIDNGVDIRRFSGQEAAGLAVRAEFGLKPEALLFGIIGRMKPQKDHLTFLRAAAEVYSQLPGSRFLVIGDGPLRSELEAETQRLGLEKVVIFTGLRSDIPALLAAMDVLVFSSRWEGLPVTLLEGMAAARPLAATAVDGIRTVAIQDVTALLVPPGDPEALAFACLRLGHDPALARRMGQAGRERVTAHYSIEAMIDRTANLYTSLLQRRGLGSLAPGGAG